MSVQNQLSCMMIFRPFLLCVKQKLEEVISDRTREVSKLAYLTYAHILVIESTHLTTQTLRMHCILYLYHYHCISIFLRHYLLTSNILLRATFPGAPSYGGVRTWVEGSQTRGNRALAELPTNNA